MKKSEKIEIRVSLDEKESLMRLAESEGRSVSELVRGLAKKYTQLNMPMPRPKFSRWHMAGLILCGVGIGSGAALSLSDNFNRIGTTQYMVHGAIDDHGFGFGVKDQIDTAESVTLGKGIGSYIIDVRVKNEEGEGPMAVIEICKKTENDCIKSAAADLHMSGGNTPSVWQTSTKSGDNLFLVLQPVSG